MLDSLFGDKAGRALKVIADIDLLLGIVASIILAYNFGYTSKGYYHVVSERNIGLTIGIFLIGMLSTLYSALLLYTIGDTHEKVMALRKKVEEDSIKADRLIEESVEKDLQNGEWKCPDCGRINASYVGTCACGKSKI